MQVRKYTLIVAGKDDSDFDAGLEEAMRLIKDGNVEGFDSNETSGFRFMSTTVVHPSELPI